MVDDATILSSFFASQQPRLRLHLQRTKRHTLYTQLELRVHGNMGQRSSIVLGYQQTFFLPKPAFTEKELGDQTGKVRVIYHV